MTKHHFRYQPMTHEKPWSGTVYRLLVLGTVAFVLPSTPLGAQANPESVKMRNDCRLAAQMLSTGEPAPKVQWAWEMIYSCPESGSAAAAGLRRLRADADTGNFSPVTRIAFSVRDGDLFTAALEVAGDRGASTVARGASFFVLITQLTADRYVDFDDISRARSLLCPLGSIDDRGTPMTLTPLPADAAARATAVASSVAESSQESEAVRIAADCIMQAARQNSLLQP